MENDREAGKLLFDFVKNVECERRGHEAPGLGIAGALLGFELVCAVAGTDGDCEGVASGAGCEVNYFLGTGVVGFLCGNLIFDTCENAELGLYGNVILVCIVNNLLCEGDVLFVRKGGSINHDGAEAHIHAALAKLEAVAVVEMENDLGMLPAEFLGIFNSTFRHIAEKGLVGIVARTLGNLEDDRALGLCGGLDDGLELLHVVEVESGDGVTALDCLCEHLAGVHKAKIFVIYHSYKVIDRFLTKSSANLVIFADTLYYLLQEMSQRILFIHGLASSGKYKMADQLRILVKGADVLAPDVPPEPDRALTFLQSVCQEYCPDLIVGHSLGGSLAQCVAIMRNVNEAVTFNPVGIGKSMDGYLSKYGSKTSENKVINYNNPNDNLTKYFRGELYGTNYSISEIDKNGNKHSLENMKPLFTRQKANPSYKGQGVKRKSSSDKSSKTSYVGSYPVSGYTRTDGKEVKGYTCHCGAKHLSNRKLLNDGLLNNKQEILNKYKNKKAQDLSKSEIEEFLKAYL